tara:strand:- start:249 stop:746 length:498 start_codon:yes stop_codon:yes gene_type:complete
MDSEEGWTSVSHKKNKNVVKKDYKKKISKNFDKSKVKLWYDEMSWQHNVLIDNYKYEDESSVVTKFELSDLVDLYSKADTNYDKNNVVRKLTKRLNDDKWKEISTEVILKNPVINKIEEEKVVVEEEKVEEEKVEEEKVEEKKVVVRSRMVDDKISFANILKAKN